MVQHMKELGRIIFKMEMALKHGQMGQFIKEVFQMDKKREKDFLNGKMGQLMRVNLI